MERLRQKPKTNYWDYWKTCEHYHRVKINLLKSRQYELTTTWSNCSYCWACSKANPSQRKWKYLGDKKEEYWKIVADAKPGYKDEYKLNYTFSTTITILRRLNENKNSKEKSRNSCKNVASCLPWRSLNKKQTNRISHSLTDSKHYLRDIKT